MGSDFLFWQLRRRARAYYDWYHTYVSPEGAWGAKYLKGDAALEARREPYLKGEASLTAEVKRYLKGDVAFRIENLIYLKGDAAFAAFARYLKGDADLIGVLNLYLKGDAVFAANTAYLKGDAGLMINVPLGDLGETPPSTKPGVLSRHWLSIESVKKNVT